MTKNKWKTIAIIFITLFILETAFIVWAFNYGTDAIEKENECIYNVCQEAETYYFDSISSLCECYVDGEPVNHKYLK